MIKVLRMEAIIKKRTRAKWIVYRIKVKLKFKITNSIIEKILQMKAK